MPSADVLFAGAMCTFGVTPNAFDGDPAAWADALADIGELAATIVPGIGPVGGADDVLALQAYLYACVEAEGDPTAIPEGPWDEWSDRHLDAINIERAAMLAAGDDSVPAVDAAGHRPGLRRPAGPALRPGREATSSSLTSHRRRAASGSRAALDGRCSFERT